MLQSTFFRCPLLLLLWLLAVVLDPAPIRAQPAVSSSIGSPMTNTVLRLDFSVNGKYAPFAHGIAKGFYIEQQIALNILEGRGSLGAVQLVANNSEPFAFADSTATISIAAGGGAVVSVGVLQQK